MVLAQTHSSSAPHIPVLLTPILDAVNPISGRWLDGTFGAGGYTRAMLDAGADTVYAIDRDPEVFERAASWAGEYGDRLKLIQGTFGNLDTLAADAGGTPLDGVVLDIGVSSMQIDQADRGFSFMQDGPLDMRMGQSGMTAADIVNTADESVLADLIYLYGEDRKSRRIAGNIVRARKVSKFESTFQLVKVIEASLPRPKPGQTHPATRTFQALRIHVNRELADLDVLLGKVIDLLAIGGRLVVISFHSLEDRRVKTFMRREARGRELPRGVPIRDDERGERLRLLGKPQRAGDDELAANPRARSAIMRVAERIA